MLRISCIEVELVGKKKRRKLMSVGGVPTVRIEEYFTQENRRCRDVSSRK